MARLTARLALVLAVFAAACTKPQTVRAFLVKNACENGKGGSCADGKGVCWRNAAVGADICYARQVDVTEIVVEVNPTATSPLASTAPRYARFAIAPESPFVNLGRVGMLIPNVNVITRRPDSQGLWNSVAGCARPTAGNGNVGMRATFQPRARSEGIEAAPLYAEGLPSPERLTGGDPYYWTLSTPLTPGELYDVYLEPLDRNCPTPPLLVRGYGHCVNTTGEPLAQQACLQQGRDTLDVTYFDRRLRGRFKVAPGASLAGWRVEIVDGDSGLRLSVPGVVDPTNCDPAYICSVDPENCLCVAGPTHCDQPQSCFAPFGVDARDATGQLRPLEYSEVELRSALPTPPSGYLRLRPPPGNAGPTFAFAYARVADEVADIDRTFELSPLPGPDSVVRVEGSLERVEGVARIGTPGAVWFRSLLLDQAPSGGVQTLVQGAVQTEADGSFLLTLPPGTYDLLGAPNDPPGPRSGWALAHVRDTWSIPPYPPFQGGRVLGTPYPALPCERPSASLPCRRTLRALDPAGSPLGNTPVRVDPVPSTALEQDVVLGFNPFDPRATVELTDGGGVAQPLLDVDRDGAYVLTMPFELETGLPWTVRPSWPDPARADDDVVATLPWEIKGKVVISNTFGDPAKTLSGDEPPLPSGLMRIYGRQCDRSVAGCSKPFVLIGSGPITGLRLENGTPASGPEQSSKPTINFMILLPSSLLYRGVETCRCTRTRRRRSL